MTGGPETDTQMSQQRESTDLNGYWLVLIDRNPPHFSTGAHTLRALRTFPAPALATPVSVPPLLLELDHYPEEALVQRLAG